MVLTDWLFRASDNLYPSLYVHQKTLSAKQRLQLMVGRIEESQRIIGYLSKSKDPLIIPYFWYKYHDTNKFLTNEDIYNSFHTLRSLNIDGLILWGSSNEVNTKEKCAALYKYIDTVLGPALVSL